MAKDMYIGVNNVAQKVEKAYVGVNGVAKEVKSIYIGVDNIAKKVFDMKPPIKIVSWSTGSDEDIMQMISAADMGLLDLTEYQNIGDTRTITLNAITTKPSYISETQPRQTLEFVLVAKDTKIKDNTNPCYNYQYITTTLKRTYPSFIIQVKNSLYNYGIMTTSSYRAATKGQNQVPRRTQCNDYFKPALPSDFTSFIKQVNVLSGTLNGSSLQESQGDYFFLPLEKEVQGARTFSPSTENIFPQQQYYTTTNNKKKTCSQYGGNHGWQLRSPGDNTYRFSCVTSSGAASAADSDCAQQTPLGIAPCACI